MRIIRMIPLLAFVGNFGADSQIYVGNMTTPDPDSGEEPEGIEFDARIQDVAQLIIEKKALPENPSDVPEEAMEAARLGFDEYRTGRDRMAGLGADAVNSADLEASNMKSRGELNSINPRRDDEPVDTQGEPVDDGKAKPVKDPENDGDISPKEYARSLNADIVVEETGSGWVSVTAPWHEGVEKAQGDDKARRLIDQIIAEQLADSDTLAGEVPDAAPTA